jgi:hypothetical protein
MRDLLPDLLHGRLRGDVRAEVDAHVEACEACRSELELLRRVRAAVPEASLDVSHIVSALPAYRARPWYRRMEAAQLRIAAALVLIAGGVAVVATLLRAPNRDTTIAGVRSQTPDSTVVAKAPEPSPSAGGTATVARNGKAPAPATGLATGESLNDLSDAELRTLLDEIADLDAVTPTEDDVVVPSLGRSGT